MARNGVKQRGLPRPAVLALAAVILLALTGCATSRPNVNPPARPGAPSASGSLLTARSVTTASPASQSSCSNGSGFALSLVSGYHGWASPVQAAQQFSHQSDPAGYGTPSTVWTAGAADRSGVTLTATGLTLHAVRLPNGRWAIDSGQRCG